MKLTDSQKMIQDTLTKIALDELAPNTARLDKEQIFCREGLNRLGEAGFLGMTVPPPLGGTGTDTVSFVLAAEAIAKGCPSTALAFVTHSVVARAILVAGTDEQKGRFLPGLARGQKLGALAMTESGCGSNPAAMATTARTEGDDLVVNGSKAFITSAGEADVYIVVLKTDQAKTPMDFTAVIIEKGTEGFSFGSVEDTMGLRGTSDGELIFEDCRIPRSNMLGQENGYMQFMPAFLGLALVGVAAISNGIAQAAVNAAIQHGKTREVGGQPIGNYQGVQYLVSETSTTLAASRALMFDAANEMDGPPPPSPFPIYQTKLFATEAAVDITSKALQVHGGTGYSKELPLERYLRDARGLTLHFSPTEQLKGTMGQMLMGLPPFG